jgi:hypothetical protein
MKMLGGIFKAIYNSLKQISIILITLSIIIFLYYIFRSIIGLDEFFPFGNNMVNHEIIFIPHILYMKPVTLIVILGYSGFLCAMLHLDKSWGYNLNEYEYVILELIVGILLFITVYEVVFNFMLWGALISSISAKGVVIGNIDLLANQFPNPARPWNLVFATKIFYTFSITFATALYFLEKWRRSGEKGEKR